MAHFDTTVEGQPKSIYIDGYLKANLERFKEMVHNDDMDCIILIDGQEGCGKSNLGQQIAKFFDSTFSTEDICFTGTQFNKRVISKDKFGCVLYDEALSGLNKMKSISSMSVGIVDMLAEIRQKNLFIIIILPTFFDLSKNVACWRSKCLLHVYFHGEKMQRGFFAAYNLNKKLMLFNAGKKFYNYNCIQPNFRGRFTKGYTVNELEYRKLKLINLRSYANDGHVEDSKIEQKYRYKLYKLADKLLESGIMNKGEMCELLEMSSTGLASFLNAGKEEFLSQQQKEELETQKLSRRMKEEFLNIRKKDKNFEKEKEIK
jgi:hypothetical protein